jgi:hypothetical protein
MPETVEIKNLTVETENFVSSLGRALEASGSEWKETDARLPVIARDACDSCETSHGKFLSELDAKLIPMHEGLSRVSEKIARLASNLQAKRAESAVEHDRLRKQIDI